MKYIKNFEDFLNESENINESNLDLIQYVKKSAAKVHSHGGNGENILGYGLQDLARHLEAYYTDGRIYDDKTIKLFEQLVDSMSSNEIDNNQVDESVAEELNESSVTQLEKYVNTTSKNPKVNLVTFDELLIPLAQHLDSYTGESMGDLEYPKEVLNTFKKLTDGMAKAHIDGFNL